MIWGGGYYVNFLHFIILLIFLDDQNTVCLLNIIFIFDRCRHSWAVVTTVKYECEESNKYF